MTNFDSFFLEIFQKIDSNNESRVSFTTFSINRALKSLTNLDPKIEDLEEKLKETPEKQMQIRQEGILNMILKGQQTNFLNISKKEDFIPYENWKKIQEINENTSVLNTEIKYKDFVENIFKKLVFEEETPKSILEDNSKPIASSRRKSSDIEKMSPILNEKWLEIHNKLNELLQNEDFRKFFSEFFVEELKDRPYLSVKHTNFLKFISIFKDILQRIFLIK